MSEAICLIGQALTGVGCSTQNSFSSLFFVYPITRLAKRMRELMNHFAFKQRQSVRSRLKSEQMAINGHVEFARQSQIPTTIYLFA